MEFPRIVFCAHYYFLFRFQKKSLRIFCGDYATFREKFSTCARARPYGTQFLISDFYMHKHIKPIFNSIDIDIITSKLKTYHLQEQKAKGKELFW